jgi:putative transposase
MREYRKQAHATYHTRYHLVFVTKYRRKVLKEGMGQYLVALMRAVEKNYPDVEILEMNTDEDHIHLLAIIPPKRSVSEVVRVLKTNSSRHMKRRFPFLSNMYDYDDLGLWSDGYFVSTVGCDEGTIQRYIERQGQEDKGQEKLAL